MAYVNEINAMRQVAKHDIVTFIGTMENSIVSMTVNHALYEKQDLYVKNLIRDLCRMNVGRMLVSEAADHAHSILTEHLSNWTFGVESYRPKICDRILLLSWVESGARGLQRSIDLKLDLDSLIAESVAMMDVMES